jgi:hypothetical protein
MAQKLLIGGLTLAIVGVIGFGLVDAARVPQTAESTVNTITAVEVTPSPAVMPTPTLESPTAVVESTPDSTPQPEPVAAAQNTMGDAWQAEGTIVELADMGLTLATTDGEYFVELGPATYWQTQAVSLTEGDMIRVDGYYNGEQVHARVVYANGAELVIRSESGQPMWAGGINNAGGSHEAGVNDAHVQIVPEDWLTLTGTIGRVSNGQVTLSVNDGSLLDLQMGRPNFWQSQGITLSVGDPVEVLGFWSGSTFMAGDIRKTETGETIMLRDPNGRQLWAGPGTSGAQGGEGQQGANGQGNGGNNQQGSNAQGNGNQYRGGQE